MLDEVFRFLLLFPAFYVIANVFPFVTIVFTLNRIVFTTFTCYKRLLKHRLGVQGVFQDMSGRSMLYWRSSRLGFRV